MKVEDIYADYELTTYTVVKEFKDLFGDARKCERNKKEIASIYEITIWFPAVCYTEGELNFRKWFPSQEGDAWTRLQIRTGGEHD